MDVIDFAGDAPATGDLGVRWIHGSRSSKRNTDPPIQVHRHDPHTVILRQSKAVHFEAPFLYLLFGNDRALLLDTGATADPDSFPLRRTVDGLVEEWLEQHPRDGYELVVAHSHAHRDHIAGDPQFADRPSTVVVAPDVTAVKAMFGFADAGWPTQVLPFDLGGRVLEVTGIPGHHDTSIAIYDPWTRFLFTGDTVLPGRLYVHDFPTFVDSLERLVAFCGSRPVARVLGCHVEMKSRPGKDYPIGADHQPDESPLPMSVARLTAVRDAAVAVADKPGTHTYDDFIIFHGPCRGALVRYTIRYGWGRVFGYGTERPANPQDQDISLVRPTGRELGTREPR
jgi:glyoxylase-like metal-dependent hydrolase (beta-lactamase superfamily II)